MPRMIEARFSVPLDVLAEAMAAYAPVDRHRAMVERLGEACSKTTAAHEISCTPQTITVMIEDGRLLSACEGTKVDVRSLADYIARRSEIDHQTRMEKRRARR